MNRKPKGVGLKEDEEGGQRVIFLLSLVAMRMASFLRASRRSSKGTHMMNNRFFIHISPFIATKKPSPYIQKTTSHVSKINGKGSLLTHNVQQRIFLFQKRPKRSLIFKSVKKG